MGEIVKWTFWGAVTLAIVGFIIGIFSSDLSIMDGIIGGGVLGGIGGMVIRKWIFTTFWE